MIKLKNVAKIVGIGCMVIAISAFVACSSAADSSGSDDDTDGTSSTSSALWSSFEGCDIQIWYGFTADTSNDYLEMTVGDDVTWWGGAFVNDASATDAITFDMSDVAEITFSAKGSDTGSFWISHENSSGTLSNQTAISLSTDWESCTYTCNGVTSTDLAVFAFGGGDLSTTVTEGYVVSIKNIAFWDAEGNEIVPTRNE
jgi:hypothetical protein